MKGPVQEMTIPGDEWEQYYAPREAARDNDGKPPLAQVLWFKRGLEQLAWHMERGREKYPDVDGVPNFVLGGKPDAEYTDAAMRHLAAFIGGAEIDPETGTEHLSAAVWNLLALQTLNREDDWEPPHYGKGPYYGTGPGRGEG